MVLVFIIVAVFLVYFSIPTLGHKALIVRSGSMEPRIKTGDLLIVNLSTQVQTPQNIPIYKYKEGEVITFKDLKNSNILMTHKIVTRQIKNGTVYYQTKGDTNKNLDTELVPQEKIIGNVYLTFPALGKVFAFTKEGKGFLLLVALPIGLAIIVEGISLRKNFKVLENTNPKQVIQVELKKNQKVLFLDSSKL